METGESSILLPEDILKEIREYNCQFYERGISWDVAKNINVDFSKFTDVGIGRYEVELLLKIWNKRKFILHCYFCDLNDSSNLFTLCAFRNNDGIYSATDMNIDISNSDLGTKLNIEVGMTKTGRNKWISAQLLE